MKRKQFSVEQIVSIVKQAEMGMPVVELIRKVGITSRRSIAGRSSIPD
jgi:putative transposase